jgi:hypothetical protein
LVLISFLVASSSCPLSVSIRIRYFTASWPVDVTVTNIAYRTLALERVHGSGSKDEHCITNALRKRTLSQVRLVLEDSSKRSFMLLVVVSLQLGV